MLSSATFCHNFVLLFSLLVNILQSKKLPTARSWGLIRPLNVLAIFSKSRRMQTTDDFSRKTIFLLSSVLLRSLLVFSPAQSLLQGKAHIDHISEQMQRNCFVYKEYNANARLQMKYMWLQITRICLCVFAGCSSLHLSLSPSNIPGGGDLPLKLWGDLLSVCLVPLSHICTALAQRIIYMKYIFDIFLYNNP